MHIIKDELNRQWYLNTPYYQDKYVYVTINLKIYLQNGLFENITKMKPALTFLIYLRKYGAWWMCENVQ